jgi:uncharacterized protein YjbI with pentapeptide repeats
MDIHLGRGDFSLLPVSFGNTKGKNIDFGESLFSELNFGTAEFDRVDFSHSQIGWLYFDSAQIDRCFFSDFKGFHAYGGNSNIAVIFGERGDFGDITLESMHSEQFNVNHMKATSMALGKSSVSEMYMSNGEGVGELHGGESILRILNLHESRIREIDFENSQITRALLNKCSIDSVHCDELKADLLYVGNDGKNEIGTLDFGESKGIKYINIDKILPTKREVEEEQRRHVFGELKFR